MRITGRDIVAVNFTELAELLNIVIMVFEYLSLGGKMVLRFHRSGSDKIWFGIMHEPENIGRFSAPIPLPGGVKGENWACLIFLTLKAHLLLHRQEWSIEAEGVVPDDNELFYRIKIVPVR